jgi:hypothetical protein
MKEAAKYGMTQKRDGQHLRKIKASMAAAKPRGKSNGFVRRSA